MAGFPTMARFLRTRGHPANSLKDDKILEQPSGCSFLIGRKRGCCKRFGVCIAFYFCVVVQLPSVLDKSCIRISVPGEVNEVEDFQTECEQNRVGCLTRGGLAIRSTGTQNTEFDDGTEVSDAIGAGIGHWHPHLMFFVSQTEPAVWGANLPKSPIIASEVSLERLTVFLIPVGQWSEGTADSN